MQWPQFQVSQLSCLQIVKLTKEYVEAIHDAPKAIQKFMEEVQDLLAILYNIEIRFSEKHQTELMEQPTTPSC